VEFIFGSLFSSQLGYVLKKEKEKNNQEKKSFFKRRWFCYSCCKSDAKVFSEPNPLSQSELKANKKT